MAGAAAAGALFSILAAWLWRSGRKRAIALGGAMLAAGAGGANILLWLHDMAREEVAFASDGVRIEGTLMLPSGVARPPVAVILHGSAPFARDFYAVWARRLVADGIAVLVYDKRGTGRSAGNLPDENDDPQYLVQLGRDAAQAVAALSRHPRVDRNRISLVGISQGGWTGAVAASLRPDLFRIAFLSGPLATTSQEGAFSAVTGERNGSRAADLLAIRKADAAANAAPPDGFDPLPYLAAIDIPGRWYFGERDRSVPVSISKQRLARLAALGRPVSIVEVRDGDHLLIDRSRLPIGFAPGVLPDLARWLAGES